MSNHRANGYITRSRNDPKVYTQAARQASLDRFWQGIPEDLPPQERQARYEAAKRAHFVALANKRWAGKRRSKGRSGGSR